MEVYFENIKGIIIKELNQAKFSISICVAWVSENFIIEELCNCLRLGIQVELLLNNDDKFEYSKHKFNEFVANGGRLFLYDTSKKLMHNKFCVIDLSTTITGSFNWTYGGTKHEENIIIERRNIDFAHTFARQFLKLKRQSTLFSNFFTGNADLYRHVKVNYEVRDDFLHLRFTEGSRSDLKGVYKNEFEKALGHQNYPEELVGFWKAESGGYMDEHGSEKIVDYIYFICVDSRFVNFFGENTILER
ncbi:unnamed protein product [Ectocarpus sp. 12 AP-2014]